MKTENIVLPVLIALCAGAASACGDDVTTAENDAGTQTRDGGAGLDSGGEADASAAVDSGGDEATGPDAGGFDAGFDSGAEDGGGGEDAAVTDGSIQDAAPDGDAADTSSSDAGTDVGTDAGKAFWTPGPGTTWQIQYQGALDTSIDVEVYDIDLFDTSQPTIDALKGAGRNVICYFSAGSYEDWRPDKGDFNKSDYGKPLDNWPGEWWLDVRSQNVRNIMAARLDLAVSKKCDGVDPDNVDGYQNDTGFPLTAADQENFLRYLAKAAHDRGLAVGLKNCLGLVKNVVPEFQWQLNEECLAYDECSELKPFIDGGKAVFHIEYIDQTADGPAKKAEVCGDPTIAGFSTLIKTWDLSAWRMTCE